MKIVILILCKGVSIILFLIKHKLKTNNNYRIHTSQKTWDTTTRPKKRLTTDNNLKTWEKHW